jgi:tyrosyl-tRNA synthetase
VAAMSDAVLLDLADRGLIQDHTDLDALRSRLIEGPITVYAGFDPTASSLQVGNLVPLLLLRRFQDHGHRPIVLAGGATGMIGDPGGRSVERNLLDAEEVRANVESVKGQLRRFLDFDRADPPAVLVDNRDWTEDVRLLDFLRDVGKHATVGQMIAKESVRARLGSEHGISYTEFSYMLLQANDFWWLNEHEGCELQVGGSDQWGNITAGIDMIRRRSGRTVHGLTVPMITRSDGSKFGKSQGGAVWLDRERTSPYRMYQFFMQADDVDVDRFLRQLTLLPVDEIETIVVDHQREPHRRRGQRALAQAFTALVHGDHAAAAAGAASDLLFGGEPDGMGPDAFEVVAEEVGTTPVTGDLPDLVDLVARTVAASKGEARRLVDQRGVSVNSVKQDGNRQLEGTDFIHGRWLLLRKGKSTYHLAVRTP